MKSPPGSSRTSPARTQRGRQLKVLQLECLLWSCATYLRARRPAGSERGRSQCLFQFKIMDATRRPQGIFYYSRRATSPKISGRNRYVLVPLSKLNYLILVINIDSATILKYYNTTTTGWYCYTGNAPRKVKERPDHKTSLFCRLLF
jgi:hypothetical protein